MQADAWMLLRSSQLSALVIVVMKIRIVRVLRIKIVSPVAGLDNIVMSPHRAGSVGCCLSGPLRVNLVLRKYRRECQIKHRSKMQSGW